MFKLCSFSEKVNNLGSNRLALIKSKLVFVTSKRVSDSSKALIKMVVPYKGSDSLKLTTKEIKMEDLEFILIKDIDNPKIQMQLRTLYNLISDEEKQNLQINEHRFSVQSTTKIDKKSFRKSRKK